MAMREWNPKVRLLKRVMSALSEEYYCAQWLIGNEYRLWADLTGEKVCGERGFGITDDEKAELRLVHEMAGGWIVWSDEAGDIVFLSDTEWQEHLKSESQRRIPH
jgi:hypothetical protein